MLKINIILFENQHYAPLIFFQSKGLDLFTIKTSRDTRSGNLICLDYTLSWLSSDFLLKTWWCRCFCLEYLIQNQYPIYVKSEFWINNRSSLWNKSGWRNYGSPNKITDCNRKNWRFNHKFIWRKGKNKTKKDSVDGEHVLLFLFDTLIFCVKETTSNNCSS